MQLVNTFGGSRFGMLTDKYGINWMQVHLQAKIQVTIYFVMLANPFK